MSYKINLNSEDFIRLERDRFKQHGIVKVFIYKCKLCSKELRVQQSALKRHSGRCVSCSQKGKPFEAVFNELMRDESLGEIRNRLLSTLE